MTAKKSTPRRPRGTKDKKVQARDDSSVDAAQPDPDLEAVDLPEATTIEALVTIDSIEYVDADEEGPATESLCRLNLHVDLPEHVAQHLFAEHVREGDLTVEFHPADPRTNRRNALLRR